MNSDKMLPKNRSAGSIHLEWKRCGSASCCCTKGLLHGPYVYRHRRYGLKQKKTYVAMRELAHLMKELGEEKASMPRPSMMRQALKGDMP